ncbi:N-dimethylarginine dimethylaminohydrolase [Nitrobacter vulgaris]|uniref:hypothetical protein n=1 Tax=Nitrobacter vulgaris TaxID=29421 RepID=UPI00285621A6|nr:hypothetical protein [Nitrobacter vulgaris]MDR6306131.1 N-dimethylarginine dimethylaminohydrolase [Nitrobacter vulgaris]
MIEPAQRELDGFVKLLESFGIKVRRPDAVNWKRRFRTPDWHSRGFVNACPRDSMLVIGDEIVETPMAWPTRYFETHSYRTLLKEYFRAASYSKRLGHLGCAGAEPNRRSASPDHLHVR